MQCLVFGVLGVYDCEPQRFFVFGDAELLSINPRFGSRSDLLDVLNDDCKGSDNPGRHELS